MLKLIWGLLFCLWLSAAPLGSAPRDTYLPPEVILASETTFPMDLGVPGGTVVLKVALDSQGKVVGSEVERDIQRLGAIAQSSVKTWQFKPGERDGKASLSEMTVAFSYVPQRYGGTPLPFSPVEQDPSAASSPAGVVSVIYPPNPTTVVRYGADVVQVSLDKTGGIYSVKTIRELAVLNGFAKEAAKKWKFSPARLDGKAVRSNVAIAFVFAAAYPISKP